MVPFTYHAYLLEIDKVLAKAKPADAVDKREREREQRVNKRQGERINNVTTVRSQVKIKRNVVMHSTMKESDKPLSCVNTV
jgi:hypothetical protein